MKPRYDYTVAGLDGFLSRSIDSVGLGGFRSPTNQLRFDSTQISGALGDSFRLKNILTDGRAGRNTYFDEGGNPVLIEGQLEDKATGIRIQNESGVGLIQFGKFGDNSIALKIAKSNIDVATASEDQLKFSSNQNSFKILKSGIIVSAELTVANPGAGLFNWNTATTSVYHGLSSTPFAVAFMKTTNVGVDDSHYTTPFTNMFASGGTAYWENYEFYADGRKIHLRTAVTVYGMANTASAYNFKYFLLQETNP